MAEEILREVAGELVVLRCWCGIQHAVPRTLRDEQLRQHDAGQALVMHCPLGHTYAPAGKSEAEKLREKLERTQRDVDFWRNQKNEERVAREQAERRASAARGQVTKIKNRVGHGVCPCCKRSFGNVARHMATKHPGFAKEGAGLDA